MTEGAKNPPPYPLPFSPSLISLVVSVGVKHRVYLFTIYYSSGSRRDQEEGGGAGPAREPRRDQEQGGGAGLRKLDLSFASVVP